jgi:hypothetical protein
VKQAADEQLRMTIEGDLALPWRQLDRPLVLDAAFAMGQQARPVQPVAGDLGAAFAASEADATVAPDAPNGVSALVADPRIGVAANDPKL